jgi:predicted ATPase/DNA-binding CsgD family transcriptional regulator
VDGVTPREAEVLALLGEGLSNAQVAHRLRLSVRTVENHVSSLLRKHAVTDRRALAVLAGQAGGAIPAREGITGLPVARTGFVGRAHEHDAVLTLLGTARLVTLVGPGGVGKTRLAAVVADAAKAAFPLGGAFVDLVPVRDGFAVPAVAAALGVTERPHRSLLDAVTDRLGADRWLLVLDNCEHLLDAVAALADRVLSRCPATTILATSRERLGVPGERVIPISPLPLASDAEALFVDRALAADPEFSADPAAVAEICSRLDGLPLAIELVAARTAALTVAGLRAALDDALSLLSGSRAADARHRSLRDVLGWSHDLLDDGERALFRRLAVFVGGFDLGAAVAVTVDGRPGTVAHVLGRLVEKSLVVRAGPEGPWRMLDTIRAFALDRLRASGEHEDARQRHLSWAVATATALADRADHTEFDRVADDLRAALAGCPPGPGAAPHRLARCLGDLTFARRFPTEALDRYREAADRAPSPRDAAADLRTAAQAVYPVGLAREAFDLLLAAAGQARVAGDGNAEAIALAGAAVTARRFTSGFPQPVPPRQLDAIVARAVTAGDPRDPPVAAHLAAAAAWPAPATPDPARAEAAVTAARATGDPVLVSAALDATGTAAAGAGRLRAAYRIARERLALLDRMDRHHPYAAAEILDAFHFAWLCAFATGDLAGALSTARSIGRDDLLGTHPYRPASKIVPPLVLLGRFDEALHHAEVMWTGWQRSGAPIAVWVSPAASAAALARGLLGDDAGRRLWQARAAAALGAGTPVPAGAGAAFAVFVDARLALHAEAFGEASDLVRRAFAGTSGGWLAPYARAAAAELAVHAGLPDADERLAAAATEENDWAAACLARARRSRVDQLRHA